MRTVLSSIPVLKEANSLGAGLSVFSSDFRHKSLEIGTDGMGAADTITVKVYSSNQIEEPDFDSAADINTNSWAPIQGIENEDGSPVDGNTGITFSDGDSMRRFAINEDFSRWITVVVTVISDAVNTTVTANLSMANEV